MVFAKYLLVAIGFGLVLSAVVVIACDVRRAIEYRKLLAADACRVPPPTRLLRTLRRSPVGAGVCESNFMPKARTASCRWRNPLPNPVRRRA